MYIIIDNNYEPLIVFQQVEGYLNEPIKIDELINYETHLDAVRGLTN